MSAYNWLKADVICYECQVSYKKNLQIAIGWCQYHEYVLNDELIWMDENDRERAEKYPSARTAIEIGSPDWQSFSVSNGAFECPNCLASGTVLVSLKNNIFTVVKTVESKIPYGEIVFNE